MKTYTQNYETVRAIYRTQKRRETALIVLGSVALMALVVVAVCLLRPDIGYVLELMEIMPD